MRQLILLMMTLMAIPASARNLPKTPGYLRVADLRSALGALAAIKGGDDAVRRFARQHGISLSRGRGPFKEPCPPGDLAPHLASSILERLHARTRQHPGTLKRMTQRMKVVRSMVHQGRVMPLHFKEEQVSDANTVMLGVSMALDEAFAAQNPTRTKYLDRAQLSGLLSSLQHIGLARTREPAILAHDTLQRIKHVLPEHLRF